MTIEDRNQRLAGCAGFSVHDPGGRIGVVAELGYGSRRDRPDFLVVRQGLFRRRTFTVPVERVVEIDQEARTVLVHGEPSGRIRWSRAPEELEGAVESPVASIRESGRSE